MPRNIALGNGNMLVMLDQKQMMHDFYFPYVGMENHTGYNHFHRIGIWIDNRFSWLHTDEWRTERLAYVAETLVTDCRVINESLGIAITFNDCVDATQNVLVRKLTFHNLWDHERSFRVFFNQDFHLYGEKSQDTALYEPTSNSVIHYRKNRYFLANGRSKFGGIATYTIGKSEFMHFEGTWRDAEDGSLKRESIGQGSVDSTVGFEMHLPPRGEEPLFYWICAGKKFSEITQLHRYVLEDSPESIIYKTSNYWLTWVNKQSYPCLRCISPKVEAAFKQSLLIMRTQIDNRGAIIAANDSDIIKFNKDTYTYMWPRDGALVANTLDQIGYGEITRRFYKFCADVITDGGFLLHKYNPDQSLGSSWHPWFRDNETQLPIQEDETALVIYALWQHYQQFKDIEFLLSIYKPLVKKAGEFLMNYINANTNLPQPSYDLWEEHRGISTFTVATVYSGLVAASNLAETVGDLAFAKQCLASSLSMKEAMLKHLWSEEQQRFYKYIKSDVSGNINFHDSRVDASAFAVWYFGVLPADDPRVVSTMQQIKDVLWVKTDIGGIARYEHDYYQNPHPDFDTIPGNPWYITTLWYAQWLAAIAKKPDDLQEAFAILDWCVKHGLTSYVMPEQLDPYSGVHVSVAPLTWSHSTFVETVFKVATKYEELNNRKKTANA